MRYNYKTQELVDKGTNFATIFPEKQTAVKEMTGFDFDLQNIVNFMQKETDNFTKEVPLALDIDKYIYSIYVKSLGKKKEEPTPAPTPTPASEEKTTTPAPTSKKTLETRLKIVKAMMKKDPDNKVLKTRIKIIEKQLKS